jgi:hypothetical protein
MTLPRASRPELIEMPSFIRSPAADVRLSWWRAWSSSESARDRDFEEEGSSTHALTASQVDKVELAGDGHPLAALVATGRGGSIVVVDEWAGRSRRADCARRPQARGRPLVE